MIDNRDFEPDWVCPPGETIEELMEEHGMDKTDLARRLGCSRGFVHELLRGVAPITDEVAERLSRVFGTEPDFWLRYEAIYRRRLHQLAEDAALARAEPAWLRELPPHGWMVKTNLVRAETKRGRKMRGFLRYFGVGTVQAWRDTYLANPALFRASSKAEVMPGAVAVWLRACELEAKKVRCSPFDKAGFARFLKKELRGFTHITDAGEAMRRIQEACAPFGVAVVSFPTPPKCPLSGATWWVDPHKAIIGLSLRFKTADDFWFSFAHEAGHVLKHSKKSRHIGFDGREDKEAQEADDFARDLLIPPKLAIDIPKLKTAEDFLAFAERAGVAPGVVVGRAQRDFGLPQRKMRELKVEYTWPPRAARRAHRPAE